MPLWQCSLPYICFLPPRVDPLTTLPVARSSIFLGVHSFRSLLPYHLGVLYVYTNTQLCIGVYTTTHAHNPCYIAIAEYQASVILRTQGMVMYVEMVHPHFRPCVCVCGYGRERKIKNWTSSQRSASSDGALGNGLFLAPNSVSSS